MDFCVCTRDANKTHCPYCGSYVVYASRKSKRIDEDGVEQELQAFRCRRCGKIFDEWQWQNDCQASPPLNESKLVKAQRKLAQSAVTVSKEESADLKARVFGGNKETRLDALKELMEKAGLTEKRK
jgi:hypothetical protein